VTLLCCLPLGVVSIIFAAQVDGKVSSGDIAGAQDASKKADMFANIALIGGLVWIVICVAFGILGGLAGA